MFSICKNTAYTAFVNSQQVHVWIIYIQASRNLTSFISYVHGAFHRAIFLVCCKRQNIWRKRGSFAYINNIVHIIFWQITTYFLLLFEDAQLWVSFYTATRSCLLFRMNVIYVKNFSISIVLWVIFMSFWATCLSNCAFYNAWNEHIRLRKANSWLPR